MYVISMRKSSGVLPVYLLFQSSGKQRGGSQVIESKEEEETRRIETIWRLLVAYPEAILCG